MADVIALQVLDDDGMPLDSVAALLQFDRAAFLYAVPLPPPHTVKRERSSPLVALVSHFLVRSRSCAAVRQPRRCPCPSSRRQRLLWSCRCHVVSRPFGPMRRALASS